VNLPGLMKLCDFWRERLRNNVDFSPSALEQVDFTRCHFTAANHQHWALFEIGKYW
jgi:uncharacterized protein YjbI with pentapeptide repeats